MFDKLKEMKEIVEAAKKMKQEMQHIQKDLQDQVIERKSSDGGVSVKMSGEIEVIDIQVTNDELLKDKAKLVVAVTEAVNSAAREAKQLATNKLAKMSSDMGLPKV